MPQFGNGLARAVRPQEGEYLARADLQVDTGHRFDAVVGLPQSADLDHGRTGNLPLPPGIRAAGSRLTASTTLAACPSGRGTAAVPAGPPRAGA
jgi:hypothetical protein